MITEEQAVAAQQALSDLQSELRTAWLRVSTSSDFFSDDTAKPAALRALEQTSDEVERLGTTVLDRVRRGEILYSRWVELAFELRKAIIQYSGSSSDWSLSSVLWGAAQSTGVDLAGAAQAAKPWYATTLGVVALVAIAVIITKVKA